MFPELPKSFEALTDEELSSKIDELKASIQNVAANRRDPDVVGERTQAEVRDEMAAAVAGLEQLQAELEARTAAEAEYDEKVAELAAKAGVDLAADPEATAEEPEGDEPEPEGDEPEATTEEATEPEAVAAAAATKQRRPLPAARKRHRPSAEQLDDGTGLRAGRESFALSIDRGDRIDQRSFAKLLAEYVKRGRIQVGDKAVLASASYPFPEDRQLGTDPEENTQKIEAVVMSAEPQALVAAGGLCAPLTPIYDLPGVETAARPVRDALPSFQANRGGVIVGATPTMGDYADAVGVVTAAEDEAGGTFAAKSCLRIDCPEFTSIEVDAIYQCIEAGNLTARAYPELMARIDTLVRAEQARLADSRLLTAIKVGSTNVTGGEVAMGAVWSLLGDVFAAAAAMRSRNRMPEGATLRALFPAWLIDLLALDVSRGQFDRFGTRQRVVSILEQAGINTVFHLDGPTGGTGQVFGAQSAGALDSFPDELQWALFPEGTWLHLDSGQLDLGIVRDSTLNSTNDFQIFAETWENIAYVGVESLWVTTDICPNGTVSAPDDQTALCAG